MRILVSGGSGFIGRNLISHLAGKAEIVFLGRSLPEDLSGKITEYVYWDILSGKPPRKNVSGDILIHLAGIPFGEEGSISDYRIGNTESVRIILSYMKKNEIPRILFASSVSVYGNSEGKPDESSPLLGTSGYAVSKIEAEKLIITSRLKYGIFRIASVYGEGGKSFLNKLIRMSRRGFVPYPRSGKTRKSFIHSDDLSCFMISYINKNISGIWNICHPEEADFSEILALLEEIQGRKLWKVPVPGFFLKLEGIYRKAAGRDFPLKPLLSDSAFSSDKAVRDLGYRPAVSLKEGLRRLV